MLRDRAVPDRHRRLTAALGRGSLFSGALIGALASATLSLRAQTIVDDPLHGFCAPTNPSASTCLDGGTNTPTSSLAGFGFTISPGPQTGDFLVDFLVPNIDPSVVGYNPTALTIAVNGTGLGLANSTTVSNVKANLVSTTAWLTGNLAAYLSLSGTSPDNPIGAFLPSTQAKDASATGFFVYQVDLGQTTIAATGDPTNHPSSPSSTGPVLSLTAGSSSLPAGAYALSFLEAASLGTGQHPNVATANSGALFLTSSTSPPTKIAEPAALALFAPGLLGLAMLRRRRRA